MEPPGPPNLAMLFVLPCLALDELMTMTQVCKSFRDAIVEDVLVWRQIVVERRSSNRLTDEILIKVASKAHGRLQVLALLNCHRITDDGLITVVKQNPHVSKLYVPGCTGLTPEGVIKAVTTLTQTSKNLTTLKINGVYNLNHHHLEALESLLPKGQPQNPRRLYHKYNPSSFQILDSDTRPLDVELCPKCQQVRLVFDCASKTCSDRCRGCLHCVPRCEGCGRCCVGIDDEVQATVCKDCLCLDCWLLLPKCNQCNKPFCPRHAHEGPKLKLTDDDGESGFVCQDCRDRSFDYTEN